jgi:hypothetical protein
VSCPACGRALSGDVLQLEDDPYAAFAVGAPADPTVTTVERAPSRWRRDRTAIVAGLAVLAIVAGLVVLSGDGASEEATPATTRRASSTTASTRPDVPTTRAAPTTSPPPITGALRLLGEPTGLSMVVLTNSGLQIIDLDTAVTRPIDTPYAGTAWTVIARDGGLVLAGDRVQYVPLAASEAPQALAGTMNGTVLPGRAGDRVWLVQWPHVPTGDVVIVEIDMTGTRTAGPFTVPSVSSLYAGDRGVVVSVAGGVYVLDGNGQAQRVADGVAVGAGGTRVAVTDCGEDLDCRLSFLDLDSGRRDDVVMPLGVPVPLYAMSAFSPDGTQFAFMVDDGRLFVVDRTGAVHAVPAASSPAQGPSSLSWSPDGEWLFWHQPRTVWAYKVRGDQAVEAVRTDRDVSAITVVTSPPA